MGGKDVPLRYILPTGARPVSDAVSALGAYTFADAARYVRAPVATVRAWFLGTKTGWGTFQPVLHLDDSGHRMLSFRNLVELYVLNSIRKRHRVTLFRVGIAIDILSRSWKSEHPLAEQDILTDGYELFAENRKTPWREACRLFPFPSRSRVAGATDNRDQSFDPVREAVPRRSRVGGATDNRDQSFDPVREAVPRRDRHTGGTAVPPPGR